MNHRPTFILLKHDDKILNLVHSTVLYLVNEPLTLLSATTRAGIECTSSTQSLRILSLRAHTETTGWAKKTGPPWFILNSSVKNQPILVFFGTLNPEETSHQKITNLSTAPVKCSHCTLFSETNIVRVTKTGPCRLRQPPWKLHDRVGTIDANCDVTPTSQFASIVQLKQAIVSAWQQLSQAFIDKSINEWRCRLECVVQQNGGHMEHSFK